MTGPIPVTNVEPNLFVIFGATGDLGRRKLLPAFHRLMSEPGKLGTSLVLGVAGSELTDDEFRELATKALIEAGEAADEAAAWCRQALFYLPVGRGFEALRTRIEELEAQAALPGNRAFYMALPPAVVGETVDGLGQAGLHEAKGWVRLVLEKPFGVDLESGRELNDLVHAWFGEHQVYRIDHYLGKVTVQNLLVFRFANPLFESAWNRDRVASVEITVAESDNVGSRGRYYDRAGAVRDILQNHLTQLLALVAMEPPVRLEQGEIRDEKVKALKAIWAVDPAEAVLGQYTGGEIGGVAVPGYAEEVGHPESETETFVAVRLGIDNWRWQGVPFYLRTGKRLARRVTEIDVSFRPPPVYLFEQDGQCQVRGNVLRITLQPDEGFELLFDVKTPEEALRLDTQALRFDYEQAFGRMPDAYETLLYDVMTGDQTLFVRSDEVEEAWRIWAPLISGGHEVHRYPAGSWGPEAALRLPHRKGHRWVVR